jgi:branched-chain amino acid transport system permease protein
MLEVPVLASLDFVSLPQQLVNGLMLGAIYALIALGYTMVYGVLRLINFAHGEVFMLGAYVALFGSWMLGFTPQELQAGNKPSSALNLVILLVASMAICATVGLVIERFAYRPMRNSPRIAALITAIGVSMLLQFGGALFLPNSPPPSIAESVNPYRGSFNLAVVPPAAEVVRERDQKETVFREASRRFDERFEFEKTTLGKTSQFDLTPEGRALREEKQKAEAAFRDAENRAQRSGLQINVGRGQFIMLIVSLGLMLLLRQLVMKTQTGRAMRAVSHDFDAAGLMGINVNRIVAITFVIGSALAGAGGMMIATFMSTPLTTFYGVIPGVKAFVAAVLGGIGNIPGAVLGGLLMGVAETLVIWAGYSSFRDAIAFVILIVVLLFRPGGLLGSDKVEKV